MERGATPVEPLTRLGGPHVQAAPEPWARSVRARIFAITFILTTAVGLIATFAQPSVYTASATVLMSAPSAIDAEAEEADIQSVAIQRRVLLGTEVTRELAKTLQANGYEEVDTRYLRATLQVEPVDATNLVTMSATGEDAALLPGIVDAWIDVYLAIRAAGIHDSQTQTLSLVRDQLAGLDVKLAQARSTLEAYRQEHDIISAERQENDVMARLEGLQSALNNALEAEVLAKARMDAMEKAIAQGEKIIPQTERDSVGEMETELRQLRTQLDSLTKNYTLEYVRKQPKFRDIPARIAELEQALSEVYSDSQNVELSLARQEYDAARQSTAALRAQLDILEDEAAEFTSIYATHEALVADLARLEELNRETQSRLVEVQVNPVDKYPQVSVIDRPAAQSVRIGPDYLLWLGASFGAATMLSILAVWLYGFLSPPAPEPAYVTLSGVHMYPQESSGQIAYNNNGTPALDQETARLLEDADKRPED